MEYIRAFFEKEWTREEKILVTAAAALAGLAAGLLLAPLHKIEIGNGKTNYYEYKKGEELS